MTDTDEISLVGVFDSGLGGLSVVRALQERLPSTSFVYFGDTARFPYGTKSPATIRRYSLENTSFLLSKGAQVVVIGCNTATSVALDTVRKKFSVPIFGVIEPAAKKAASVTKIGRIGVIGTTRTIKSQSYKKAITRLLPEADVFSLATPLLVTLIEDGSPSQHITRQIVREYVRPLKNQNIDTLLLGCTHYSLLGTLLQEEIGEHVTIIDPAQTSAEALVDSLFFTSQEHPKNHFFASDDPTRFKKVGELFLGVKMGAVSKGGPS
jgi:glutamate racemase